MRLEKEIHLITIATPAYNGENDPENPANADIDSHLHFYSEHDMVQTFFATLGNLKKADRTYTNNLTINIKVNDKEKVSSTVVTNPYQPSGIISGQHEVYKYNIISSHYIEEHREDLLEAFENRPQ